MKIELSKEQIKGLLKALYAEKFEIKQRNNLYTSQEQENDEEYVFNQDLRVLLEQELKKI